MVCTKLIKIEFWNLEFKQMYKGIPFRFLKSLNLNENHIITAGRYHSLARQYCIWLFFVARSKYTVFSRGSLLDRRPKEHNYDLKIIILSYKHMWTSQVRAYLLWKKICTYQLCYTLCDGRARSSYSNVLIFY